MSRDAEEDFCDFLKNYGLFQPHHVSHDGGGEVPHGVEHHDCRRVGRDLGQRAAQTARDHFVGVVPSPVTAGLLVSGLLAFRPVAHVLPLPGSRLLREPATALGTGTLVGHGHLIGTLSPVYRSAVGGSVLTSTPGSDLGSGEVPATLVRVADRTP